MFSEERVTHMAAYFLLKSEPKKMPYIKLLKMLYLSERKSFVRWGSSMSGDNFVSMPHGPVMSQTYDLIRGHVSQKSVWQSFIKDEANYEVSLSEAISEDDIDELSRAEMKILDDIHSEFGQMGGFDLVGYTHDHCAEWNDPNGSSFPISPESILRAVGKSETQIEKLVLKYQESRQLQSIRATLR
ncbi:hypothetical protein CWO07_22725 [Vibrio splendidus]|uniref:Antitoxin SocA-like Panacea domain-containing protein n=1 Tax=Vibrio splendidus TaxID=29497 RepID=A0A2T5EPN7_VIBSP|nr:Panacea domain-containing protein [Vibrio splendidus]PTP23813.1 hypothetical protein CWO07_22725 [Vibrio splendidus]